MLSDAPAHHLFCLLPPVAPTQNSLPEVLAVVQVREGTEGWVQTKLASLLKSMGLAVNGTNRAIPTPSRGPAGQSGGPD